MTPNRTTPADQSPAPHRAPGILEELTSGLSDISGLDRGGSRDERLRQRSFDGWLTGRIRKQSRHWRRS